MSQVCALYHAQLSQILTRVCDELSPAHQRHVLPRLELNLGALSATNLEDDFLRAFERELRSALGRNLWRVEVAQDQATASLNLLETFLTTGNVPFWAQVSDSSLVPRHLQQAGARHPRALLDMLTALKDTPGALERLARHLTAQSLALLVSQTAALTGAASLADLQKSAPEAPPATITAHDAGPPPQEPPSTSTRPQMAAQGPARPLEALHKLVTLFLRHEPPAHTTALPSPPTRTDRARPGDKARASHGSALAPQNDEAPLHNSQSAKSASTYYAAAPRPGLQAGPKPPLTSDPHAGPATTQPTWQSPAATPAATPATSKPRPSPSPLPQSTAQHQAQAPLRAPGVTPPVPQTVRQPKRAPQLQPPASTNRPQRTSHLSQLDEVYSEQAGLVLLWPFLEHFFGRLALLNEQRVFASPNHQSSAVALLDQLAQASLHEGPLPEYQSTLSKVLCGLTPAAPLADSLPATTAQQAESQHLLQAVLDHSQTPLTPEELRTQYLSRHGMLAAGHGAYCLRVEPNATDAALARWPWSWSWVKLPWMPLPLQVQW